MLKKYPMPKKKKAVAEPVLPAASEPESPTPEQIKQWEKRLIEVNTILKRAYQEKHLPPDEYHALREEQTDLRAKVGHN